MAIHHNVTKKAASHGLVVKEVGNEFVVENAEGKEVARDLTARDAVAAAVQAVLDAKLPKKVRKALASTGETPKTEDTEGDTEMAKTAKKAAKKAAKKTPKTAAKNKDGKVTKTIVADEYRKDYNADDNCGDDIATAITAYVKDGKLLNMEKLQKLAEDNEVDLKPWKALNNGQISMNLRNVLRARHKRGEKVKIAGRVFS